MKITTKAITGQECVKDTCLTYAVLVEFYKAFNAQDFELMQTNWLQSDEASMSNPLGGVTRGWSDISEVYKKIFNGAASVYVELYDYTIHKSENMFVAVGRERGTLTINNEKIDLCIRTSRTYSLQDNQWKQIHHHGSMEDPELLASYQDALLSNTHTNAAGTTKTGTTKIGAAA